jgi:hypothetical protein
MCRNFFTRSDESFRQSLGEPKQRQSRGTNLPGSMHCLSGPQNVTHWCTTPTANGTRHVLPRVAKAGAPLPVGKRAGKAERAVSEIGHH